MFSLDGLKAGDYTLQLSVHDKLGQTDVSENRQVSSFPSRTLAQWALENLTKTENKFKVTTT